MVIKRTKWLDITEFRVAVRKHICVCLSEGTVLTLRCLWQTQSFLLRGRNNSYFFFWRRGQTRVMASSCMRFLRHIQRRTTVGRTPQKKLLSRRRDLYLTTHNTHTRQTTMPPAGFKPTISGEQRKQTLYRAATGTSNKSYINQVNFMIKTVNISH